MELDLEPSAAPSRALHAAPGVAPLGPSSDGRGAVTFSERGEPPSPTPPGWRGSLGEALLESERAGGGRVAFASADWERQACVRVESAPALASQLTKLAGLAPEGSFKAPAFGVRQDGTIYSAITQRDAYLRLDGHGSTYPPKLQEAADRHFASARSVPDNLERIARARADAEGRAELAQRGAAEGSLAAWRQASAETREQLSQRRMAEETLHGEHRRLVAAIAPGVRLPPVQWVPSTAPDAKLVTDPARFFGNVRPVTDGNLLRPFLESQRAHVQEVAEHYQIHPRAIALAIQVESDYNWHGPAGSAASWAWFSSHGQLNGTPGFPKGMGFGAFHHSAVKDLYPGWSERQSVIARMNSQYAVPLIAAEMDRKALEYERVTQGALSIRNDALMLAWAYNTSMDVVRKSAEDKARSIAEGRPVVFDVYQNDQLGGLLGLGGRGMAWYAERAIHNGEFSGFIPRRPLPTSPTPYTFPSRPKHIDCGPAVGPVSAESACRDDP